MQGLHIPKAFAPPFPLSAAWALGEGLRSTGALEGLELLGNIGHVPTKIMQ